MHGSGTCLRITSVAALGKAVCVTRCTTTGTYHYLNLNKPSNGEKNNPQPSGLQLMKVDLFSNAV